MKKKIILRIVFKISFLFFLFLLFFDSKLDTETWHAFRAMCTKVVTEIKGYISHAGSRFSLKLEHVELPWDCTISPYFPIITTHCRLRSILSQPESGYVIALRLSVTRDLIGSKLIPVLYANDRYSRILGSISLEKNKVSAQLRRGSCPGYPIDNCRENLQAN